MQSKANAIMRPLFPLLKHFVQALIGSLIRLSCRPSFVSLWGSKKSRALHNRHRRAAFFINSLVIARLVVEQQSSLRRFAQRFFTFCSTF